VPVIRAKVIRNILQLRFFSIRHAIPVYASGVISDLSVEREFILFQHGSDSYLGLGLIFDGAAMHLNDDKQTLYKIYNSLCCFSLGYPFIKR
jgi:hypothetical protein